MASDRINWNAVLPKAAAFVNEYDTPVTLRQLHYRLVSTPELKYPNTVGAYKSLSSRTAELRRQGRFPDLADRTRTIHRASAWDDPEDAVRALLSQYRVDRTEGQDVSLFLTVEKSGLVNQMQAWFGHLGVPIIALSGYSSQSYVKDVLRDVENHDRPAVMLYAGDFDPSGEDIDRDFAKRTGCWKAVRRVALTAAQVEEYDLPPELGKAGDSRAAGFVARHGALVQVEVDAVPLAVLRSLFEAAIAEWWDDDAYDEALAREAEDRTVLADALEAVR
jgi:hypothetical protein